MVRIMDEIISYKMCAVKVRNAKLQNYLNPSFRLVDVLCFDILRFADPKYEKEIPGFEITFQKYVKFCRLFFVGENFCWLFSKRSLVMFWSGHRPNNI